MDKKTRKDSLTGNEIVDVEFLEKDLYPPKKLKQTDAGKEWAKFWNEIRALWSMKPQKKKETSHVMRGGGMRKQPCMAKMYYTSSRKNHVQFLLEYMTQKNKDEVIDKPVLFNGYYDEVPLEDIEKYAAEAGERGFKIILSPESQDMPMKELARTFIKRLERLTGHSFTWFGAVHTNTDHIHCHLLINAVDRKTGEKFKLPREHVKNFRNYAADICTEYLGPRTREMVNLAKSRLPEARRFTKIDEIITEKEWYSEFETPETIGESVYEASVRTYDIECQKRLAFLCGMGLARCFKNVTPPLYYLEKDWRKTLRALGRYNTYLTARNELKYVARQNFSVYEPESGPIDGVITKVIHMNEEDVWNNALIIENQEKNRAWYVPVRYIDDEDILGIETRIIPEKNQHGKLSPTVILINQRQR